MYIEKSKKRKTWVKARFHISSPSTRCFFVEDRKSEPIFHVLFFYYLIFLRHCCFPGGFYAGQLTSTHVR